MLEIGRGGHVQSSPMACSTYPFFYRRRRPCPFAVSAVGLRSPMRVARV